MSLMRDTFDYPMPSGEITGPSAWYGSELTTRHKEWIRPFSAIELNELDTAMRGIKERGLGIVDISQDDFPLPILGPALNDIRQDVLRGRGFALLRGLPVDRYSTEESAIIYFGLGTHMGIAIAQNMKGHVLGHVKDLGRHEFDPNSRIYQTTARQQFQHVSPSGRRPVFTSMTRLHAFTCSSWIRCSVVGTVVSRDERRAPATGRRSAILQFPHLAWSLSKAL